MFIRKRKLEWLLVAFAIGGVIAPPATSAEIVEPLNNELDTLAPIGRLSGGIGFGMLHSGYGVNVGFRTARSLSYVSLGCEEYSSIVGCEGTHAIGHFRTDLLGIDDNRNAIGLYGGRLARADYLVEGGSQRRSDSIYGIGVGYVFFSEGISRLGFTAGIGYEVGRSSDGKDHHEVAFQLGVQF